MKTNLEEGIDFYYTPEGYIVLTEHYHLERGHCCGNGCRHCPFDYERVPEARRKQLLEERKKASDHSSRPDNDLKQG